MGGYSTQVVVMLITQQVNSPLLMSSGGLISSARHPFRLESVVRNIVSCIYAILNVVVRT